MTLRMARCIGRAGCDNEPGTRGLCRTCYQRHAYNGTLENYPTMQERTRQLKAQGYRVPRKLEPREYSRNRRNRLKSERVLLDGYMVHPISKHGTLYVYTTYGCRGPMCRAAQRWYVDTGEGVFPLAKLRDQTAEDCVLYKDYGNYR